MKRTAILSFFVFSIIAYSTSAQAGTIYAGAQAWYSMWDSGMAQLQADIARAGRGVAGRRRPAYGRQRIGRRLTAGGAHALARDRRVVLPAASPAAERPPLCRGVTHREGKPYGRAQGRGDKPAATRCRCPSPPLSRHDEPIQRC